MLPRGLRAAGPGWEEADGGWRRRGAATPLEARGSWVVEPLSDEGGRKAVGAGPGGLTLTLSHQRPLFFQTKGCELAWGGDEAWSGGN